MVILICGSERVLSNDNHLKSFVNNLLTSLLESGHHVLVAVTKTGTHHAIHAGLTEVLVSVNGYLPFKKEREKARIIQEIKKIQPDVVLAFDESYSPSFSEIVLITQPITRFSKLKKASSLVLSDYLAQQFPSVLSLKKLSLKGGLFCKPVVWDKREYIKQQYSEGREYFYCSAYNSSIEQLTTILKGFSLFKKWQNSGVKLLLAEMGSISVPVKKLLEHYRYRTDVTLIEEDLSAEADIIASSFLTIYMPDEDNTGLRILNYMQAEVPVITRQTGAIAEMAGDGVMYCDSRNIEEIATSLKLIYKDEKYRSQVISKARSVLKEKLNDPGRVEIAALLKSS